MDGPLREEKRARPEARKAPIFSSTGPSGHRQRMRWRVLQRGASSLADYEILEMLLFPGVPRRDTKPLAKALLNHFGSLAAVLGASEDALRAAGVGPANCKLLGLVPPIADRMGTPDAVCRTDIGSWDNLLAYCDTHYASLPAGSLRVLFLDSRNQLLEDEAVPADGLTAESARGQMVSPALEKAQQDSPVRQAVAKILQRALVLHASALITVRLAEPSVSPDRQMAADSPFVQALLKNAPLLTVELHDHLVLQNGAWRSFRLVGQDW